jgi:peroxiredoxin Q/BCP
VSSVPVLALIGLLLLSGAVASLRAAGRDTGAGELAVGMPAPEFTLPGSDGRTYTLSQFKGRQAVVVAWFPKAFTGG